MSDGLADCADKSDEGRYCQLSLHGAADLDCCRLKGTCFKTETLKSQNLDQDQSCEDQDRDRDGDFANSVSRRSQNQDSSLENSKPVCFTIAPSLLPTGKITIIDIHLNSLFHS